MIAPKLTAEQLARSCEKALTDASIFTDGLCINTKLGDPIHPVDMIRITKYATEVAPCADAISLPAALILTTVTKGKRCHPAGVQNRADQLVFAHFMQTLSLKKDQERCDCPGCRISQAGEKAELEEIEKQIAQEYGGKL